MKISDTVFGIIIIIFSVLILIYSRTLPSLPGYAYGSGFFPAFTAVFMLGGGIVLLAGGLRSKAPLIVMGEWAKSPRLVANICLIPLNLVFYMLTVDTLGFVVTSFAMMTATIWWLRRKVFSTLLVSALTAIFIYLFFAKLMLVPLPEGLIGL
ncbi:MAG: tripartite tricarboxylate transporter TctB family protein [Synergistaceae bacterium]|nr:tripartite tricarboxylate transporter TctB family protein [Synergistaceae bacterium]